jgi:cytidylate kinase
MSEGERDGERIDTDLFITVSGPPGCGVTTLCEGLSERLGCSYVSGGEVFREIAEDRGMSLTQLTAEASGSDELDRELDRRLRQIAETWGDADNPFILESRLAGYLAAGHADLRIWLDAPEEVRIERLSDHEVNYVIERPEERTPEDVGGLKRLSDQEEVGALMRVREVSEAGRYESYYGIDLDDRSFYDLSVNTARWDADTVLDMVLSAVEGYAPETDEGAFTTSDVEV